MTVSNADSPSRWVAARAVDHTARLYNEEGETGGDHPFVRDEADGLLKGAGVFKLLEHKSRLHFSCLVRPNTYTSFSQMLNCLLCNTIINLLCKRHNFQLESSSIA